MAYWKNPKHAPVWNINVAVIYENVKNRIKLKMAIFCHFLGIYEFERSFLIIFSAIDDLVKVS